MAHPNARANRAEEVAQERRRRRDGTLDRRAQMALAVPEEIRAAYPDRDFRWINDSGNRLHHLTTRDDWDKVAEVQPQLVGTDKDGKPMKAYLCVKPKEFVLEDEKAKMEALKEDERAIFEGHRDAGKSDLPDSSAYIPGATRERPSGGNQITRS